MIDVHVVRDKQGFIWKFTVKGHAGYGKHGKDIVCSAVSAIAYTAIGALEELVGIKNYSEKDGYMMCSIPTNITGEQKLKVQIILDSTAIGFKQIEYSYKKFVSVLDEEV